MINCATTITVVANTLLTNIRSSGTASNTARNDSSVGCFGISSGVRVSIQSGDRATARYAVQARFGNRWQMVKVLPGGAKSVDLAGTPDAVAVSAVDRFGNTSAPVVL